MNLMNFMNLKFLDPQIISYHIFTGVDTRVTVNLIYQRHQLSLHFITKQDLLYLGQSEGKLF